MNREPSGLGIPDGSESTTAADIREPSARRRWFIRHRWTIACEDLVCVFCTCGRSRELEREEDGPDDFDLIA
jgi:hypothetical protein